MRHSGARGEVQLTAHAAALAADDCRHRVRCDGGGEPAPADHRLHLYASAPSDDIVSDARHGGVGTHGRRRKVSSMQEQRCAGKAGGPGRGALACLSLLR